MSHQSQLTENTNIHPRRLLAAVTMVVGWLFTLGTVTAQYLDNNSIYSNQDPHTETRRSDHFRMNFGHYNRDTGTPMTEQLAQGNLQEYEQMWHRWVVEMGLHDINESVTTPDGNKYRANFNFLMTWDDGGGGGAYSSMDSGGFFYAMANTGSCRYDPPSGATPHEFGHVWEGTGAGFNGSNSSGAWWECTANWMLLQFLNSYPQAGGYISNGMYYPAHGRDYYDSWVIWEAAREDPRYGAAWVDSIWTNATADQRTNEYIIDRMIRLDSSGSADKAGAINDLWGDMARKMVTWDFARQRWLAQANSADDGSDWNFYQRCRTPLVKLPGASGWYRPSRDHTPMEFGFNFIPLTATPGTTVSCNFHPQCDPVRQSDWRACLVAVDSAGAASYSSLWNSGTNSINLSADQTKLYLVVIATPKPMKIADPAWQAYLTDAGLQFPYAVSFTNAAPKNVIYPVQSHSGMLQHANGGGWKASSATVDASAYVGANAQVLGGAQVRGNARVEDYAVVKDSAQVRDNAVVSGHAMVEASGQVYGNAKVRDWGHVFGCAEVYESGKVIEHGNCGDGNATTHTKVYGNAIVKGTTYVYDTSTLNGGLIMEGDSANGNGTTPSSSGVHFGWGWGQDTARFASLPDNGYLFARHSFEKDNAVFAMDEFGINHGFLMNGCRSTLDSGSSKRGGRVLALDGISQYVELHNAVNDFKDSTFAVWCKASVAAATDQRLWSLGDGVNKVMYLTPNAAATSKPRFVISDGTTTLTLDSSAALAANTWSHLAVVFSGSTCTLYLNGVAVANNPAMSLLPDSLNAPLMENANYLGRGYSGNYFQGALDDFRCYMRGLTAAELMTLFSTAAPAPISLTADTTPPTPNSATWLGAPMASGDSRVTMSATPGSDASGWVEYYFACVSGGGHDSGWVSFNKYTDFGLTPGSTPAYTVTMRDRSGNTTGTSAAATATLATSSAGSASFSYGPIGIADGQITMRATQGSSPSGKLEYKFDRTLPTAASSGWQASATWTQSGLTTGTSYTYTVTVRDGRGNTSVPSAPVAALARDDAGPALPSLTYAHWQMLPYATIDNKVSMTAMDTSDPSGAQYYFHCISGGGPDSGWQAGTTYVTPALADGTYVYQYKVRDLSARNNESAYSTSFAATITPTTGYHSASFAQARSLPDDSLVTFNGVVMQALSDHYVVKDVASNATISVTSDQYAQATDSAHVLKLCQIKGHLWTYGATRSVTYAAVTPIMDPPAFAVSGKITDAISGLGIAGASVYFSSVPGAAANASLTATTDASGLYSEPVPNGQWYVAVAAPDHFPPSDQTLVVNGSPLANINFSLNAASTITSSGGAGGSISPAGAVLLANGTSQAFAITPNGGQSITGVLIDGVEQGSITSYTFSNVTANHTLVATFSANTTHIPQTASLLDSALAASFPASGLTGNWASYLPAGKTYTAMGTPSVNTLNNAKWDLNLRSDGDGFDCGDHGATAIACSGASIVAVIKPTRNTTGDSWNSIVDVFYDRLVLGIYNNTGRIIVRRNGGFDTSSSALPDGQTTVLSLIVQPDGSYKIYANGSQVSMSGGAAIAGGFSSMVPGVAGAFATHINIGRNNPDGWTVFNGNIGDFFIYKVALSDAERQAIEGDMSTRFGIATPRTITASAGIGGSLSPSGSVSVANGGSATFVASSATGFAISQLTVDGVSQGALTSYTFSDVAANHTISASFSSVPTYGISASAGANGSINPSGTLVVNAGSNQTIAITPGTGYQVADVVVDGVSQGAVASYTFTYVQAAHTLSATFGLRVCAITASAAAGGTISPGGTANVSFGSNQTFAITPNTNYAISSVLVDGVDVGAPASYTFNSVIANHTIAAVFIAGARKIPAADQLFVALDTKDIVGTSSITSWPWLWPTGKSLTNIASPTVQTINSTKWEWNMRSDGDGLRVGQYTSSIPVTGGTIICAIKPTRNATADGWNSVVDVMYGEMVLGVSNATGLPQLRLKKAMTTGSTAIPDGQKTILSLVVQPAGNYTVYANGVAVLTGSGAAMNEWLPGNTTGNPSAYDSYIDIGRSDPDSWSAFNGNIGDVFLYKTALTDSQRQRLEADMMSKFGVSGGSGGSYSISASAATGGTISPAGTTLVSTSANQTYIITPSGGYTIADVQIDGISVGVAGSYTFTHVFANHTINATFAAATSFAISAAAGSGGSISPSGSVIVNAGASQMFGITPDAGYGIAQVTVDGVLVGSPASYTFSNVLIGHSISATFAALPAPGVTLARHSGTGTSTTYGDALSFDVSVSGSPVPSGIVVLKDGGSNGTIVANGTLIGGSCSLTTALDALAAGSHANLVAVYAGDGNFAPATSSALSAQIVIPKLLTVLGTSVTSKPYDGTTAATLTGATLPGLVASDAPSLDNASVGTFSSKDAGSGKVVSTAMALSGTSAPNYTLAQPALTGTITPKALTVTGTQVASKPYDGNTVATLTGATLNGTISGEALTLNASGTFNTKDVGRTKPVTSTSTLSGAQSDNYSLTQPTGLTGNITARGVGLTGNRTYDGTAVAAAADLIISNNLDAANLGLTGSANLAGKDVGSQALVTSYVTPARVGSAATGSTGASAASSFGVSVAAPAPGNTLVAVISTRSASAGAVTGISNTGTTLAWTRAVQSTPSISTTSEIWYAPVLAGAGTSVTISLSAAVFAAAVIVEYSGVLSASPLDASANNSNGSNSTAASTGTTAMTTQANELAVGGIGLRSSGYTLGTPTNAFVAIANAASSGSATSNAKVYAFDKVLTATGTVASGGTVSTSSRWSGAIATFRAASSASLALTGPAASNYTLAAASGAVTVTPKPLVVSGLSASGRLYDGTSAAVLTGTSALLPAEAGATGSSADGKPYSGDALTLAGTPAGTFADKHVGNSKPVSVSGLTLGGAQAADYTLSQPSGLSAGITPRPVAVTAVTATKIYDGTTVAAGIPTVSPPLAAGDTASVLSESFQDGNAGEGIKVLIPNMTISDGNNGANYAVTLANFFAGTITMATATITLSGLAEIYDGTPKAASATSDPAGLAVVLTYDGSSVAPTAPGSYTVAATLNEANYAASASGVLVIAADALSAWRHSHFTSEKIAAGLASDSADPDGDGLSNLAEFTLGTDPNAFTPQLLVPTCDASGKIVGLTFLAHAANGGDYTGLTRHYTVETSPDLAQPASWQALDGFSDVIGGDQTVVVPLSAAGARQFYRLNVRLE